MTTYVIINPDQVYPFAQDIKEGLEKSDSTGKVLILTAVQQLKKFPLQKRTSLFSPKLKYTRSCITKSCANCFILV